MSKKLAALAAEHQQKIARAQEILSLMDDGKSKAEDETEYDSIMADITSLESDIDKAKAFEDNKSSLSQSSSKYSDVSGSQTIESGDTVARSSGLREMVRDDVMGGFANVGELADAVYSQAYNKPFASSAARNNLNVLSAISEEAGKTGVIALPPAMSKKIIEDSSDEIDNLIARTDNYTLEDGETLNFLVDSEAKRKKGKRGGGMNAQWIGEDDQIDPSEIKLRDCELKGHELASFVPVPEKMLRRKNKIALGQFIQRKASGALKFTANEAIFNGNGIHKPQGILKSKALLIIPKEVSQTNLTILLKNINRMYNALPAKYRKKAAWFINQETMTQIEDLQFKTEADTVPVFIPQGGYSSAPFDRLKNLPIVPLEYCEGLGTMGDIVLADFSQYMSATRGNMLADSSIHFNFDRRRECFRFIQEVGGQTMQDGHIQPYKGDLVMSPFIALANRK